MSTNTTPPVKDKKMRANGGLRTHGKSRTKIYKAWSRMIDRCHNPKSTSWPNYGGRGIRVCERWWNFESFIADMGERPFPRAQLDRINNDGDYEPGNCRWATLSMQRQNTRVNRYLGFNGEVKCLTEWARVVGIAPRTLASRIELGWPVWAAITKPIGNTGPKRRGETI